MCTEDDAHMSIETRYVRKVRHKRSVPVVEKYDAGLR
jgi:hypothetical protein